jgi:putative addiction module killer protein
MAVVEIRKTDIFTRWLDGLRDLQARACPMARRSILDWTRGVSELRISHGPGYRVYYKQRGRELVILLAGGDKSTQAKDISMALKLARNL